MTSKLELILFALIFIAGAGVRMAHFPHIPGGLNQDEAASAYESYALLKTGADKWGNPYPAYFIGEGAGMNVLQSYLSIPIIAAFGLNIFSTRLLALILGCLTLPLIYFTLKPFDKITAITAMFLVAFCPWHWMLSRWALESNLLPFFLLLSVFTFSRAIQRPVMGKILVALIPMALSFYAYATSIIVVPLMMTGMVLLYWKDLYNHLRKWGLGLMMFLITAFPYGLFLYENFITGHRTGIENKVFFSWPIIGFTRLNGITIESTSVWQKNIQFILSGFNDGTTYNMNPDFPLLWELVYPLFWIGVVSIVAYLFFQLKSKPNNQNNKLPVVFFIWILSALPLIQQVPLNINRANAFFIPILVLAAIGFTFVYNSIDKILWKRVWSGAIFLPLLLSTLLFCNNYFTVYNEKVKQPMNAGLENAFHQLNRMEVSQYRISHQIPLPVIYALFYSQYDPDSFRKNANYKMETAGYHVKRFGKYFFMSEGMDRTLPYAYLARVSEDLTMEGYEKKPGINNGVFEIGICWPVKK